MGNVFIYKQAPKLNITSDNIVSAIADNTLSTTADNTVDTNTTYILFSGEICN